MLIYLSFNLNMKKEHPIRCHLCGRNIADKKNSHIIPSFIMCRVSSSDGTGKRNHELTFSIGKSVKVFTGNEVPMNVMNNSFDDLSEERINEELKKNEVALDFVFCSSCEKLLADYLEAPYSNNYLKNSKITPKEQYYFWISVLWRVSHFQILKSTLPKFITAGLRKSLDAFLQAKKNKTELNYINEQYPMVYRIIRCKEYDMNTRGCIYAEYDKANKIYSLALGDRIVCFSFSSSELPMDYKFMGVENLFREAKVNTGQNKEYIDIVSKDNFDTFYANIINFAKNDFLENEVSLIYKLWKKCLEIKCPLPSEYPSEIFIKNVLINIHDEKKKIGDRHTHKNFALSFINALDSIYNIKIPKS